MSSPSLGRALLVAGALLLLATAAIHATGTQMIAGWTTDFEPFQRYALQLVWLTDSFDWAVVAAAWLIAARYPSTSWSGAAMLLALIPAACAAGILFIEPRFFGAYLLLGSVGLAATGVGFLKRGESNEAEPSS